MHYLTKVVAALLVTFFIPGSVEVLAQDKVLAAAQAEMSAMHAKTRAYMSNGQVEDALRNAKMAYAQSLEKLGPEDKTTAILGLSLANLLAAVASTKEALTYYALSLKRFESLYGNDGFEVAPVLVYMSEWQSGEEQIAAVQRALAIHKKHQPENIRSYAQMATKTGGYLALGRDTSSDAIPILENARSILEAEFGQSSTELIPVLISLGDARARYRQSGRHKRLYRRAIDIAKRSGDAGKHAEIVLLVGKHLMEISGSRDARPFLLEADQLMTDLYGPDDARTAYARLSLARYNVSAGDYHQALASLKESLKTFEQDDNYRNHQMATLSLIVDAYENLGERDEATAYCRAIGKITPWTEDQEVKPILTRAARYPRSAWKRRREGYVVLEFTVDQNGFVESQKVLEIDGPPSFEAAALAASEAFRYAPRFVNGEAVNTMNVRNTFTFKRSGTRFWTKPDISPRSSYRLVLRN